MNISIALVHNIRSAHNVGSIFRSADGAGFVKVFLTGYTPLPATSNGLYKTKAQKMLAKTALGSEMNIPWEHFRNIQSAFKQLRKEGYMIIALEQNSKSISYDQYQCSSLKKALIVGNEVRGIDHRILDKVDDIISIPMYGSKKSLNVAVAFGVAAYSLRQRETGYNESSLIS